MSAEERLQTARLISPSGATFEFIYENVSVEVDKKTTEFTFPEKDGAYIQDLGRAGRRFPFTLFFNGVDYDLEADAFLLALEEKGVSRLEHPRYGDRNVVPTGTITRVDNLVDGLNQASFSITFSETLSDLTFPTDTKNQESLITSISEKTQQSTADEFAEAVQVDNVSESILLVETSENSSSVLNENLGTFVKVDDNINSSFIAIASSYADNAKNILEDASGVISQAILLTRIPSQIETTIEGFIDLYERLIELSLETLFTPDGSNNPRNDFLLNNALVTGSLTALCESTLNAEIATRPDAIEASEIILDLYNRFLAWRDENNNALEIIDTPLSYFGLSEIISKTTSFLISESFDLPREIRVTLQNDRNLVEFLASVGLDVETNMDNFIQWNDLTADTIEILEKGMEVVYYA